jgi:hypothetical protein
MTICDAKARADIEDNLRKTISQFQRSDSDTTETESPCSDLEPSIASADAKRSISIPWSPPIARRRKGVVHLTASHGRWLAESRIPKLFINAEPGAILTGRQREFCRTWRNQTEITVEGIHFIQEDSPDKIGPGGVRAFSGRSSCSRTMP